jgi:hypothetical protein
MTLRHAGISLVMAAQLWGAQQAFGLTSELASNGTGRVLVLHGDIERGDTARIERAISRSGKVEEVWLDSAGGNLAEGLELGRLLRRQGLSALVPPGAVCASACVYVLAGAPLRRVAETGRVGVHMFTMTNNSEIVTTIAELIGKGGPSGAALVIGTIEQASANMAADQAAFLIEMSVSLRVMRPSVDTAHDDIHWLSVDELQQYNLVNTE